MKVIKTVTFTVVLTILLIGCRQEKASNTNEDTKQKTTQEAAQETTKKAEVIKETKELTATEILAKAITKCKAISSIEYNLSQKGAPGKYGYGQPKIQATIIQKKDANTNDIGFGRAFIKASGFITEKKNKTAFAFSYDGKSFMHKKGNTRQKSVSNPTRRVTMGKLQQYLFMMRVFPFAENEPFKMPKKSDGYEIKVLDEETKQGMPCYKLETSVTFKAPNGGEFVTRNIWWIGKIDYLPELS